MHGIEIRHLRLVTSIADHGTMTRAAGQLGLTQSALSQQLLDLEGRLGVPLFLRTGRRMVPTDAGSDFLRHAHEVLTPVASLEAWSTRLATGDRGVIRISTDHIFSFRWLPVALARFRRLYPRVEVRIRRHEDFFRELASGALDLAITFPRKSPRREIEIVPLFEDEMVAVLPPGHPLCEKRHVRPRDLEAQDLVYHMELRRSALHRLFLAPLGIRLATVTVVEQPDAILELVKAGFGLTLLPRRSAEPEAARGEVVTRRVRIDRPGLTVRWAAAIRKRGDEPLVHELVDLIRSDSARERFVGRPERDRS